MWTCHRISWWRINYRIYLRWFNSIRFLGCFYNYRYHPLLLLWRLGSHRFLCLLNSSNRIILNSWFFLHLPILFNRNLPLRLCKLLNLKDILLLLLSISLSLLSFGTFRRGKIFTYRNFFCSIILFWRRPWTVSVRLLFWRFIWSCSRIRTFIRNTVVNLLMDISVYFLSFFGRGHLTFFRFLWLDCD